MEKKGQKHALFLNDYVRFSSKILQDGECDKNGSTFLCAFFKDNQNKWEGIDNENLNQ